MDREALDQQLNEIKEKLGDEESAKIQDTLANIINLNESAIVTQDNQKNEIATLKESNQKLTAANNNLFQQFTSKQKDEEMEAEDSNDSKPKAPFDFRTCFDKNGRFKQE